MRNLTRFLFAITLGFSMLASTLEAQLLPRRIVTNRVLAAPRVPLARGNVGSLDNWYPYVVARPSDRQWIRETPIEQRPNRPLHFWGNSRRRIYR